VDLEKMSKRLIIISFLVAVLVVFSSSSYQHYTSAEMASAVAPATATPIKHIVIIMQENHAFDNMFGTFPGLPAGFSENLSVCMPNPGGACIKPWNANSQLATIQGRDIPHTRSAALKAYDGGAMDGFVKDMPSTAKNYGMAYYTGSVIPYYWDYASYFTFNYNFFSSSMSYSLPNHLFAVAAQAGSYASTCLTVCETTYNLTFPQIGESLTNAGIPWGYYQYNWNDAIDCPSTPYTRTFINAHGHTGGGFDGLWSGLADFTQVQNQPTECKSLLNLSDLKNAINSGNLPAVSWVEPEPTVSDHPGQSTFAAGQHYVSSLINLIEHSSEWSSTVIYLTWDDWGGYYDGVVPTQIDTAGDGFRVPLIAISPYSTGKMVGGPSQEDFSAFLSTIEYNWGLAPLGGNARDGSESNLFYMLNFNQTPLKPLVLASSGVKYPLSSCSAPACTYSSVNIPANTTVYNPNVGINESVSQALNYSGNDDPGD
jgi:phospholipase C